MEKCDATHQKKYKRYNFLQTSTIFDLNIKILSRLITKNFVLGIKFLVVYCQTDGCNHQGFLFGDLKIPWKVSV